MEKFIEMASSMAEAVRHLNEDLKCVHRNLKTGNWKVRTNGTALLTGGFLRAAFLDTKTCVDAGAEELFSDEIAAPEQKAK